MNMTNINNDLAAGKDVRIDFKQMQNFGECARRAKQSGSEIILFNIGSADFPGWWQWTIMNKVLPVYT